MIFNSIEFAIFLAIVFTIYWNIKNLTFRNAFLLISSYVFYGWWDARFLLLIIFSSFCDFYIGKKLHNNSSDKKRKLYLYLSIGINLGILGIFKYFNFFMESFSDFANYFGVHVSPFTLKIILPVGISFYTFQTLSYTIDLYRKKIPVENNLLNFFAFVSFFPQLVAGPIERGRLLLPQFKTLKTFDPKNIVLGLRQILWGLFQKVVIADQCAPLVNDIFNHYNEYSSLLLISGAFLFAFQIYGDFAGYSNIAIGTARLLGFNLMRNFAYPYFSRDMAEFWRRWHISLSTWFRDYLYIPLGGSRGGKLMVIRNVFIIFVVSGFWHGANWTYIVWGLLNAIYFIPLTLLNRNRNNIEIVAKDKKLPSLKELASILSTFLLTSFAWIYFRSESLADANSYIYNLFSMNLKLQDFSLGIIVDTVLAFFFIGILICIEWIWRRESYPFQNVQGNTFVRWFYYVAIGTLILTYVNSNQSTFIYFQF